jgi:hypothetical protein
MSVNSGGETSGFGMQPRWGSAGQHIREQVADLAHRAAAAWSLCAVGGVAQDVGVRVVDDDAEGGE